MFILEQWKLDK